MIREEKIIMLLKKYGVNDEEIENFMEELKEEDETDEEAKMKEVFGAI